MPLKHRIPALTALLRAYRRKRIPTDAAFDRIGTFHGTAAEMATYVQSLMHNGTSQLEDYIDDLKQPAKRLTPSPEAGPAANPLSTPCGTILHTLFWEPSFRGGKPTFTFSPTRWSMPWLAGFRGSSLVKRQALNKGRAHFEHPL